MVIAVLDGQGAGIGREFIKRLKKEFEDKIKIVALGTNKVAMQNMLKSGADVGYCGEDEIVYFFTNFVPDAIVGPIGILTCGGINGEISAKIAQTIFSLYCKKYIIPLNLHGIFIPGTVNLSMKEIFSLIIDDIKESLIKENEKKLYLPHPLE
ncbi:hypothetical protein Calkro_2318 [Caldicellulosiruptor kronotskyensis 2002]|uniref:DUF3842 family protein n=1 Tax=Caldicellulosiruptor kronotskyensis (strain DSM 18902 / VKM B-2412 / 2002) TaxID=632348 RepID=E4SHB8_CALK2|nr:DUF3842 family protein [Caldicellulosiruptor kronotskyensis]ADQ47143.1 hypothetical protein Calkro_2318 [Caldicellulosiruptor kronotskyensis 2002]